MNTQQAIVHAIAETTAVELETSVGDILAKVMVLKGGNVRAYPYCWKRKAYISIEPMIAERLQAAGLTPAPMH